MAKSRQPQQYSLLPTPSKPSDAAAAVVTWHDAQAIRLGLIGSAAESTSAASLIETLLEQPAPCTLVLVAEPKDLDDEPLAKLMTAAEEANMAVAQIPLSPDGLPESIDDLLQLGLDLSSDQSEEQIVVDARFSAPGAAAVIGCVLTSQGAEPREAEKLAFELCQVSDEKVRKEVSTLLADFLDVFDEESDFEEGDPESADDAEEEWPEDDESEEAAGEQAAPSEEDLPEPSSNDSAVPPRPIMEVLRTLRPRQDLVAGCVLGGAIGDAMGHPTEFISSVASIRAKYGPEGVTKYELYWDKGGKRFAPYTDDTQMAEAVLRALLDGRAQSKDLDGTMHLMARRFVEWAKNPQGGHRAPGNACLSGCRALEQGTHWSKAGGPTAGGCGSVMRAYPFGLVFADDLPRAERWAVEHSKLTHRDPIALAACAAMAVGVALALRGERVGVITSEMVAAACRYSPRTAAMMATAIEEARTGVGPEVTLDRLRAWAAHEAIAAAVYIFERHPDEPRAAVLEGANTPGDSDSIATLAGSLVGARCGVRSFSEEWLRDVERADELMALALAI